MPTAHELCACCLSFHTESQVRAYSVSGRGEEPNEISTPHTCNRTGNNSEGQRIRRARSHPSYESAVCNSPYPSPDERTDHGLEGFTALSG